MGTTALLGENIKHSGGCLVPGIRVRGEHMRKYPPGVAATGLLMVLLLPLAAAQKWLVCPDGERFEIDIRQIAVRYEASGLSATLSGLSVLGTRATVEPKTLQTAATATQQWNEYLKGLVAGYNSCVITK